MLHFENAPKKATNLSLNTKVLEAAREMGMNLSQTVDTLLADEVKKRYWCTSSCCHRTCYRRACSCSPLIIQNCIDL